MKSNLYMMSMLLAFVLILPSVCAQHSWLRDAMENTTWMDTRSANVTVELEYELQRYTERVKILQNLLKRECFDQGVSRLRREIIPGHLRIQVWIEKILYKKMVMRLKDCRNSTNERVGFNTTQRLSSSNDTLISPRRNASMIGVPPECQYAVNFTEEYRTDYNGTRYYTGISPECDTAAAIEAGRPWFRFTGAAGNMLLTHCPPSYACGGYMGIWTHSSMPTQVGVALQIMSNFAYPNNCRKYQGELNVMRCSNAAHDFIYKHIDTSFCMDMFCGMHA